MSFHNLSKYYQDGELEKFRAVLSSGNNTQYTPKGYAGGQGNAHNVGNLTASPNGFGTSPRMTTKNRKVSGQGGNILGTKGANVNLSRAEVNSRDHAGLTLLHRAVSTTSKDAISFALALVEHPSTTSSV